MRNVVLASMCFVIAFTNCISRDNTLRLSNENTTIGNSIVNVTTPTPGVKPLIPVIFRYGATVLNSRVVTNAQMNYVCQVKLASDTLKTIKAIELVDYHDAGSMQNMYNLRRSVRPLGRMKVILLPHSTAERSFKVNSSYVHPAVAKVFYQDGSIQHTVYDIVGDTSNWLKLGQSSTKRFKATKAQFKKYRTHDAVQEYYDKVQLENQQPFCSTPQKLDRLGGLS